MPETRNPELILDRFLGREVHPITSASWNLYRDDELERMTLCLHLEAGPGSILHEDTQELGAEPWWELNVVEGDLSEASLVAGTTWTLPDGYDESRGGHLTNFYYCEHESSDNNRIALLAVDGDQLLLRLSGETIDVNFHDGSKDRTKLLVETWFTRESKTLRSMS